ncbi:MAG: hypothetical protein ACI9FN_003247 [Saprospiraceae bacterium]|jgi:hypothetical protein
MKLEEIKSILSKSATTSFQLPDGSLVPAHFHVTEVGKIIKNFMDCGGMIRREEVANFQLWEADDYDHRLHPEKLVDIIDLSQRKLEIGNLEVEVEYQGATIGKYGLDHNGQRFILTTKQTDCLAREKCGVPEDKVTVDLLSMKGSVCSPGGGCC